MRSPFTSILGASILIPSGVLCALISGGCAGTYQVVRIPEREADMYPLSQTQAGITIAVDEIKGEARAERYFGTDLIKAGIEPVAVVVSNYTDHPVTVKPSDVLLSRGKEIIDPLPVETIVALAKSQHWFLRSRTEAQIQQFFHSVAFTEDTLLPNDSYEGVMFFALPKPTRHEESSFRVTSLFDEGGPKVRVGVTDMQTHNRLHFGPFSLTAPEDILSTVY